MDAMTSPEQPFFQHRFENVIDYIHHREPYLLVDKVVALEATSIVTETIVRDDAFFVKGHFPGAPVLPGALMQEMTTQSAGVLIAANFNPMAQYNTHDPEFNEFALGVLVKTKEGRFRGFARPGDKLTIQVSLEERIGQLFDFRGQIRCNEQALYRNSFQLTNLPSESLRSA